MKIATWNVNSIRVRLEAVLAWMAQSQPDVLCLQEIKVTDELFPVDSFVAPGYHVVVNGKENSDAAWSYPNPNDAASQIKDYVAFWKGVDIVS